MTPLERARKSAEVMWSSDTASAWLGMQIEEVDEGRATLSLTVRDHHCNGLGMCHGGITFALADSAFAFACNSRNVATVAQHNSISYVAAGQRGDVLTAHAQEVSLSGRNGIYDVRVTNQSGLLIAVFRGASRAVNRSLFEEEDEGSR